MAILIKDGIGLTSGFVREKDNAIIPSSNIKVRTILDTPTFLDEAEIVKAIGTAVNSSLQERLSTTDIANITTNYDSFIKQNESAVHPDGSVIEIVYSGTEQRYLNPPVVGIYSKHGGNYHLQSETSKIRDDIANLNTTLSAQIATKAPLSEALQVYNNKDITPRGVIDIASNSTANPNRIPTRQEVHSFGKAIEALLTAYKTQVSQAQTTQDNRLNALEASNVDKFAKGKWELKSSNIAPNNSPAPGATTATFTIPTVDDNNTSITRQSGDVVVIKIELPSSSLGTFTKTFNIEYGGLVQDELITTTNGEPVKASFNNNTLTVDRASGLDINFSAMRVKMVEQELFIAKTDIVLQPDITGLATIASVLLKQDKTLPSPAIRNLSNVEAILRQLNTLIEHLEGKAFKKADGTFGTLLDFLSASSNPTDGNLIGATIAWTEDQLDERADKALSNISGTTANKRYVIKTNAQNVPSIVEEASPNINPIKYYKGQILTFHEVKTGTQFENTSKFEKHTTYQDETLLGGTDKTRQSGTIKSHSHNIYIRPDSSPGSQVRGTSGDIGGWTTSTSSVGGNRNLAAGIRVMAVIYIAKRDIRENEM